MRTIIDRESAGGHYFHKVHHRYCSRLSYFSQMDQPMEECSTARRADFNEYQLWYSTAKLLYMYNNVNKWSRNWFEDGVRLKAEELDGGGKRLRRRPGIEPDTTGYSGLGAPDSNVGIHLHKQRITAIESTGTRAGGMWQVG